MNRQVSLSLSLALSSLSGAGRRVFLSVCCPHPTALSVFVHAHACRRVCHVGRLAYSLTVSSRSLPLSLSVRRSLPRWPIHTAEEQRSFFSFVSSLLFGPPSTSVAPATPNCRLLVPLSLCRLSSLSTPSSVVLLQLSILSFFLSGFLVLPPLLFPFLCFSFVLSADVCRGLRETRRP